jgi:hypothetical protein
MKMPSVPPGTIAAPSRIRATSRDDDELETGCTTTPGTIREYRAGAARARGCRWRPSAIAAGLAPTRAPGAGRDDARAMGGLSSLASRIARLYHNEASPPWRR